MGGTVSVESIESVGMLSFRVARLNLASSLDNTASWLQLKIVQAVSKHKQWQ